jgi:hypothetical protein
LFEKLVIYCARTRRLLNDCIARNADAAILAIKQATTPDAHSPGDIEMQGDETHALVSHPPPKGVHGVRFGLVSRLSAFDGTSSVSGSAVRAGEANDEHLLSQSFALSDELSAASDDDDDAL